MRTLRPQVIRNRKGITLLFVVSMIVLFMLLATTFLVISSQYLRGAKSYSKSEIFEAEPQNELDQVLYMLLRDTRDPSNPLRTHSLLADVYGYNSIIRGNVQTGTAQYVNDSDNSFIQITIANNATTSLDGSSYQFSQNKNSHLGQLLTITTGGMQGVTSRIVGHVYDDTNGIHYLRIYPYLDNFFSDATDLIAALNAGPEFIVNGRPFDGTGAGYVNDSNSNGSYDAGDSLGNGNVNQTRLTNQALRPNRVNDPELNVLNNYVGIGDVNEDYDAPDYQNCFLAAEIPGLDANGNYIVTVLPSFHRPALSSNQGVMQDTVFRPLPGANPNFPALTGLNTSTQMYGLGAVDANGNRRFDWDVDNDNDRVNDSIWLDPNLPVVTDKSGRTYKRMFAILCRDMDGRFNLNAHSNRFHLDSQYITNLETANPPSVADETNPAVGSLFSTVASNDGGLTAALPRGQGYGPPEINMRTILGTQDMERLMFGDTPNRVWGRNGQDFGHPLAQPGIVQADGIDRTTLTNLYDVSQGLPIYGGVYGSYPDVQGRLTFGVDYNGLPVFSLTTSANEIHENEYERNIVESSVAGLSKDTAANVNSQVDGPFSYAEIERILRGNDNDASSLPDRLLRLAPNALNAIATPQARGTTMYNRMNFGAHSMDIPSTPVDFVDELRQIMFNSGAYGAVSDPIARRQLINEDLEEMLPPELFMGTPFDINKILGDGEDQNNDLVVDNHWGPWSLDLENNPALLDVVSEAHYNETDAVSRNLDLDNDGLVGNADNDEHLVRYQNAKHLYVMMRTILRTSGVDANQASISQIIGNQNLDGNNTFNDANDLAIFVAQWAINAVDFRDKDSIMTPFEFDLNPFDGWHVDGNPAYQDVLRDGNNIPINDGTGVTANVTHRGTNYTATAEQTPYVVFGLEKPSLLMTETLAFHDRRTEDTNDDTPWPPGNPNPPGKSKGLGNGKNKGKGKDADDDNDQRLEPLGATFIEIYNTRFVSGARTADMYTLPNEAAGYDVATNNGIDLRRLSLTNGVSDVAGATPANKPSPVWRIVMTQQDIDLDLRPISNNPPPNQFVNRDDIERVIYFVVEDNGDMTADLAEYTKAELQYDLPSRVLQRNGMFLLNRTTFDALSPMVGVSSAVIGTAAIPVVGAGSYIVPFGRRTDVTDEDVDVKYVETRSITLTPGVSASSIVVRDMNAGGTEVNYPKTTLGIPIEDLNISKPIGDYDLNGRTRATKTVEDMGGDQYEETVFVDSDGVPYVFDGPFDVNLRPNANGDNEFDNFPANQNQTIQSYRILHLQRLANPLVGWHPRSNPYLTVDSMPIDLSVFDGIDQGDLNNFNGAGFGTKERGETESLSGERNLWRFEPTRTQPTPNQGPATHYVRYYLEDPNTAPEEESFGHTKANTVINYSYDIVNNAAYGGISSTFSSMIWNNRPFVSPYEIMLVPHTSSSQLLRRFRSNPSGAFNANPYAFDQNGIENQGPQNVPQGYGHLLNFLQSSDEAAGNNLGPDYCRLMDFLHVPSRFGFTSSFLNPGTFGTTAAPDLYLDLDEATNNGDSNSILDNADPGFRAPSNLIRKGREPGKVNVNTVFTPQVWEGVNGGIVGNGGHQSANWPQIQNARRDNQAGFVLGAINGPTFFPAPFRSANAGNLVPNGHFVGNATRSPVDNGYLKSGATNNPLMDGTYPTLTNVNRHPFLRFLPRSRLDNLTTTKSNVFAVWITVGYFEYDEENNQIGEEIGSNTGEVTRHRAFYMIDRSVPVGFEPGKNHNVDKTIMLRRYIE